MSLTSDLISQFVNATKDDNNTKSETTLYGTAVYDERLYVRLDGSEELTPVSTTTDVHDGDRVTVMIKDHTAVVTGNISSPAARTDDVKDIGGQVTQMGTVLADKVNASELEIERGRIDELISDNVLIRESLVAAEANIEELNASTAEIEKLKAEKLDATAADIKFAKVEDLEVLDGEFHNLESTYGEFVELTADKLEATEASVKALEVDKLSAEQADVKYANIDFTNIGEAAIRKIFADSGLISDLIVGDGTITGELVGVTLKGDLIEGNTIKADKLVVKGSDGIYYKLNFEAGTFTDGEAVPDDSLHGSVITAKSITAEKVSVKDLVAFGATIGGFNITDKSLYSGVKSSIDNATRGIYMDTDAQFNIGDGSSFMRYYRTQLVTPTVVDDVLHVGTSESDAFTTSVADSVLQITSTDPDVVEVEIVDGVLEVSCSVYKLEISADSILFGDGTRSSAADLKALTEHVKIGTTIDEDGEERPCVELAEGDSDFKQVITNTKTMFKDGGVTRTTIDKDGVETDNVNIKKEFRQCGYIWAVRANGNYGLSWKEATS